MSSNIKVQRICQHCTKEFTARKTITMYCSHRCNSAAYKAKQRTIKVEASNKETQRVKTIPIEELKAKEFLTVREVASLLNCSLRSAYYYIDYGTIKAVNLGQRMTRVKRSDIDNLFEKPRIITHLHEQKQFDVLEFYNLKEIQSKYGISQTALQNLIKRNSIPKIKNGWFTYVSKIEIDKLLNSTTINT